MKLSKPPVAEIEAFLEKSLVYTTQLECLAKRQVYAEHSFKIRLALLLTDSD